MAGFVFQILDAFPTPTGFDGDVVLAGVRADGGTLGVGDELWVPVRSGERFRARVAAFPLMSFVERSWSAVSIEGAVADQVAVGGEAVQV